MEQFFEWSFWVHTVMGGLHFGAALICLVLAPVIFLRKKGTASHKLLGRIWAALMLGLNGSALLMYDFTDGPNLFHFFAVMSLATLIPALLSIRKYKRTRNPNHLNSHRHLMIWAYFGLAAAGVWQVITRIAGMAQLPIGYGLLFSILGAITALIAFGLTWYLSVKYPNQKASS